MKPTNFQHQAYESIKSMILTAQLIPGEKISEKDLEERLSIGRTPIREAVIRLRREALFDVIPQSGTYVSRMNTKQIAEARFVRETLEQTYAQLKDEQAFFQLDEDFHHLIYQISDKENVWDWLHAVILPLNRFRYLRLEVEALSWDVILNDHQEILHTLKARDEKKITSLVEKHIDVIDNDLLVVQQAYPDYFSQ